MTKEVHILNYMYCYNLNYASLSALLISLLDINEN